MLCWSSREEIPHAQGKRNPSKTVGVARGHQRANTLKPYSQKTSQSNHTCVSQSSQGLAFANSLESTENQVISLKALQAVLKIRNCYTYVK